MSISKWKEQTDNLIHNYLAVEPTDNNDFCTLASIIYLRDKLPNLFLKNNNETENKKSESDNNIKSILKQLSISFNTYIKDKSKNMEIDTKETRDIMIYDLQNLLSQIENIVNILWIAAISDEEKTVIKEMVENFNTRKW